MTESNRIAIVTGASQGIGLQTANALAVAGYRVWALARNQEKLEALAAAHPKIITHVVDLAQAEQVNVFCDAISKQHNAIDILINNAGYSIRGVIEAVPVDQIKSLFEVNVFALLKITQACLANMRPRRTGTIINISSIAGKCVFPGNGPYSATKHALEAFTDAMRHELAPLGIRVVSIRPAFIDTGFNAVANQLSGERVPHAAEEYSELSTIAQDQIGKMWAKLDRLAPEAVADLILEIIKADNPKAAYAIGPTAEEFLTERVRLNDDEWKAYVDKKMGLFNLKL